ncbi:N-6 DNA methylase [Verrucomicrobiaceae bacterium R5-34]|nr:N-6 DNA methylase [Verrucomicrobiaceae bacterium R5-34]
MTQSQIKSKIDALWLEFHSGGITNPISVIEQISYLMFARVIDLNEIRAEKRAARLKKDYTSIFPQKSQHLRWSQFRHLGGDEMLAIVRDEVFPFLRSEVMANNPVGHFLKDANCLIPTGNLLVRAINAIEELPLTQGDTKGDLYEYLLSKLTTAGIAGQFRTPRHIIRTMVEMIDVQPDQTVCDPACGTAGFLIGTMDYLKEKYSSPELIETDADGSRHFPGDLLEPYREHIQKNLINGYDFDSTMLRIAAMNLLLHGIESPNIHYQDTLGSSFIERRPKEASDRYDVILANPPFKGTIDEANVDPSLKSKVKTKKSELLFLMLMLRMLNQGGKCAVIVPDGVLFGASKAHIGVRRELIDKHQLEAVISLPSGVFKPYAGVSTAILIFTKGGRTDDVWFYNVEQDGYSLDDKRTAQPDKNDLPDLIETWKNRDNDKGSPRTTKHFFVPVDEIRKNKYDLSLNRYKEIEYEEVEYDKPQDIIQQMRDLEDDIIKDIEKLEGMLK